MENFSLNLLIVDHYNSLISEIENHTEYVLLNSNSVVSSTSESHSMLNVLGDIEIAGLYKVRNRFIEELMRLESSNISNLYHISAKINLRLAEIRQKTSRVFEFDYLNEIKRELFQNKCCLFVKGDQFSPRLLKYIKSTSNAITVDKHNSLRLGVLLIFNWFLSSQQVQSFKKFLSDPRCFDTLTEDLLLFDLVLDRIIHSSTHIVEIIDREFYDQSQLSIRNKSLIRFNAIDPHAFVKFRHLKSFDVSFQQHVKPDTQTLVGGKVGGSSTSSSVFHDDDVGGVESFDESTTNDELASNDSSVHHHHRQNSIHRQVKTPLSTTTTHHIDQINKKLFECKTNVNLARVEELTLSLNTVRLVEAHSFGSFDRLKKLNLSYNKLRDLTDTKCFKGLVNLTELDLSMNSIVKLNREVFACLKNLETLNLASNFIHSIDKKAFVGLDKLETLNLRNNCVKFTTSQAKQTVSPFACLKSLKSLNLAENEIEHVSRTLFKGLTHLRDLCLYKNRVRSLEDNCFNMSSSSSSTTSGDGVDSKTTSLTRLDLSANQIRKLEKNMFNGMCQLEELLLNSNMIASIDELCFQDLKQLRHLDMSCNEIQSVTKDMFLGLTQLSYLIMSNNSVCDLEANCFQELENLKLLDMSYNRLDSLNKLNFQNLKSLEELTIRVNLIKSLPAGTFTNLTGVRKLDMSFNKIERLDKSEFSGLINLEELKLTGNALKLVDEHAFSDLYKLKLLDLSLNNQLEFNSGNKCVFDSLTSLEELNLVPLTKLDTRLFENLFKLNYLHFYRYKIQIIDRGKFFKAINEDFESQVESNESNTNDKCFDYEIVDYYVWAESKLK